MCRQFLIGYIAGVVVGGVGLHAEQVVLKYGPQPLVAFAKVSTPHISDLCESQIP